MRQNKLADLLCFNHGDDYVDELRDIAVELNIIADPESVEHLNFEQLNAEFDLIADNAFQMRVIEFFDESASLT